MGMNVVNRETDNKLGKVADGRQQMGSARSGDSSARTLEAAM